MHAFKFVSLPAAAVLMLLALVQGGVAQGLAEVVEVEPVPLGGLCGSIAGTASPPAYAATSTPTRAKSNESLALLHFALRLKLEPSMHNSQTCYASGGAKSDNKEWMLGKDLKLEAP
ncbi:hypothetical protein DFH08DRAFT_931913 [Mycena albidolilacea]|uniref:Uncharacterized protein n=1 Tax=Mycena albidolilacea TaxID=1033008 RepID=A0AAD7AI03_9AGAR|nr:hypothetical protein DFH08DRAFT_931913 [Mycena albidolilacea]